MNDLLNIYIEILQSLDCKVNDDDTISLVMDDGSEVIQTVKTSEGKKTLVLPTDRVLKDGDWKSIAAFHPACESIFNGQSEVLHLLKQLIEIKLYKSIQLSAVTLAELSHNKDKHKSFSLKQLRTISEVPDINSAAMTYLGKVIKHCTGTHGEFPLFTMRLSRAAAGKTDVKYSRTCNIKHEFKGDHIYDIKGSDKSVRIIRELYSKLFDFDLKHGSNSGDIPYLECLLKCYATAAEHLNNITEALSSQSGRMEIIQTSWVNDIDSIKQKSKLFLPQTLPYNAGVVHPSGVIQDGDPTAAQVQPKAFPIKSADREKTTMVTQVDESPHVPVKHEPRSGKISPNQVRSPVPQPMPIQQQMQRVVQQPVQHQQQPVYQQPMPIQQPVQHQQQPMAIQQPARPVTRGDYR